MTEPVVEPSAVISPSGSVATGRQRFYNTYNTRYLNEEPPIGGNGGGGGGSNVFTAPYRRGTSWFQNLPGGSQPVSVPYRAPSFLRSRGIILLSWIAAMAMVSLDEWHTHHVLPRPARLWYTSLTYFLLALLSVIDPLVPIASLLAIGLTIAVAYQYYNGTGSFGQGGVQSSEQGGSSPQTIQQAGQNG